MFVRDLVYNPAQIAYVCDADLPCHFVGHHQSWVCARGYDLRKRIYIHVSTIGHVAHGKVCSVLFKKY